MEKAKRGDKMESGGQFTFQREIPVSFAGKFPPDARALSGLGFDSVSITKAAITIRKSQPGIRSLPLARMEIALKKSSASLLATAPPGCDQRLQELRAVGTFLQVLSLFPSCQASAAGLSQLIIPSLDTASSIADSPYESLLKKCSDAESGLASLLAKNRALLRSSEDGVLASLELERQVSALRGRIRKLEGVSDDALLELVQDWLSSHRGRFDAAQFSRAHCLPPARAEEGLERLLASGAIHKVGGQLRVQSAHSHGTFAPKPAGLLCSLKGALGLRDRQ